MGSYVSITEAERRQMLETVGCNTPEDLFRPVPESVLLKRPLNLPKGLSELEVGREMSGLAAENTVFRTVILASEAGLCCEHGDRAAARVIATAHPSRAHQYRTRRRQESMKSAVFRTRALTRSGRASPGTRPSC